MFKSVEMIQIEYNTVVHCKVIVQSYFLSGSAISHLIHEYLKMLSLKPCLYVCVCTCVIFV